MRTALTISTLAFGLFGATVCAQPPDVPEPDVDFSHETEAVSMPDSLETTEAHLATEELGSFTTVALGGGASQDIACDSCCSAVCCCRPPWAHRSSAFAELLYLRARDAEVAYAAPVDAGVGGAPVQVGPMAVVDPDFTPGFRGGFSLCFDDCSGVEATYTHFESTEGDQRMVSAPLALRSLLIHPGTVNAASDFLTARANLDVDFQLVDLDYRAVLFAGDLFAINYSLGGRYGRMEQNFQSTFTDAGITENVLTDIDFDGAGLRLGLDMERHSVNRGLLIYGKAQASFLAGEFRTTYFQNSSTDPVVVDTAWESGRIVTMLDLELGAGWQSACGNLRVTGGYLVSAWFNTINTDSWIDSVHNNDMVGLSDDLSFDGFTVRAEYQF